MTIEKLIIYGKQYLSSTEAKMILSMVLGYDSLDLLNHLGEIIEGSKVEEYKKIIDAKFADSLVEKILNSKLRTSSKVATAFFVKEDITLSIMQIKKIHPPAHVVVVSDEYDVFNQLKNKLNNAPDFKGYYSHKAKNGGKIDYKLKGKVKHIENKKINSYSNK